MNISIKYQKAVAVDASNAEPLKGSVIEDAVYTEENGKKKVLTLECRGEDGTYRRIISSRPKIRHQKE